MLPREPGIYLLHIRDCCERLRERHALLKQQFAPEQILLDAACRNLEGLGEASRKIGADFRARHPNVPWREMNDLRNVLIHNYDGADPAMICGVVEQQAPALHTQILLLLQELGF